ncbi:WGR domain-containing protein, partial [Desulfobacterales bacterium HSG17]|nr:WGR domain-containing protein [Desulfobacterales bacterium HSG17]
MKSENITLYFKQGSSDKIYTASLEQAENNLFIVNFAYGRRGATLKTGTKTQKPVDYELAKKTYDKLVKSKTAKGYKPGEDGPQYVHTDNDARETGVQCQLLNFIEESQVAQYINDDEWQAQEKHDG